MASILIAAHNEEAVIGATLQPLLAQVDAGDEVVVIANGCTDRTAEIARRAGAIVVERAEPGKAAAINEGEKLASSFPRVYLDADIIVPSEGLAALLAHFDAADPPLAVVPRRHLDTIGRPWVVRAYFAINERLPAFQKGLFGRGMIAVSRAGRSRFVELPTMIADDLFIDSQFAAGEKAEADGVEVVVQAPFTTRDLLRRLVRVRRGNAQMRAASARGEVTSSVRSADRWAWLRDVVLHEPRLLPASVAYVGLSLAAAALAQRSTGSHAWGRDESTRLLLRPRG